METTTLIAGLEDSVDHERGASRRGRRARSPEEVPRYFLAKDGSTPTAPELGEEAANESEALIKAFQSKHNVIYVVVAFRAEAEVLEGNPVIVKRPLPR